MEAENMIHLGDKVRLIKSKNHPEMKGSVGEVIGIWFTDPVWYHIKYEGWEGNFRSTADQLEVVESAASKQTTDLPDKEQDNER